MLLVDATSYFLYWKEPQVVVHKKYEQPTRYRSVTAPAAVPPPTKQTNRNMKCVPVPVLVLVRVLVIRFPALLAVDGAGGDNVCREWGHPEGGKWNVDPDCCAYKEDMACVDGYRLQASDVVCAGEEWGRTKEYSFECVLCDAGDASCQGNLERDPTGLYDGQSGGFDLSYQVTSTIVTKATAALSVVGSSVILSLVWSQWRTDRKKVDPYQRIMAAYSLYDLLDSFFAWFLGPWMVPAATGYWSATGNVATCSAQGFFFMFGVMGSGVSTVVLSVALSTVGGAPFITLHCPVIAMASSTVLPRGALLADDANGFLRLDGPPDRATDRASNSRLSFGLGPRARLGSAVLGGVQSQLRNLLLPQPPSNRLWELVARRWCNRVPSRE